MTRPLLGLLLAAALAGIEAPTLLRPDPVVLDYDLAASAPWMPLLWDRCTLTLPAGTATVRITARVIAGDGTDLLALRDGYDLNLSGSTVTVAGTAGTWQGGSGGTPLTVDFTGGVAAGTVLLACRQLCYANLGGPRSLPARHVGITVTADGIPSIELIIDLAPGAIAVAPMLRLDDIVMAMDGGPDLRPRGWYSSRLAAAALTWRLTQAATGLAISGITGPQRSDQTAELLATAHAPDWFTTAQLRIDAAAQGELELRYACSDGSLTRAVVQHVTVQPAQSTLSVIGDFPFAVSGRTVLTFLTSDANTRLEGCIQHPAYNAGAAIANPFTTLGTGRTLTLELVPATTGGVLEGSAVFGNGTTTYRLPYRIRLPTAVAN